MGAKSQTIQVVSFDVGGTLIDPWPSVGDIYSSVAAQNGFPQVPAETLTDRFLSAWRNLTSFSYSRAAWEKIVDATFEGLIATKPSSSFFPELYARFSEPNAWHVYDDVLPALRHLQERGVRRAVVSNWDERLRPLLNRLQLDRFFEQIVISCEVGAAKPEPEIYQVLVHRLGVPASSVLHVGDSLTTDVEGARAAGLVAALLDRQGKPGSGHLRSLQDLRF